MFEFQKHVMALQLEREAAAREEAAAIGAEAIISDRGICDGYAYLTDEEYEAVLEWAGITHEQALARYDAVFHLESTAKSDPAAYTTANNSARSEDAEEAIRLNDRIMCGWSQHPERHVIGNYERFDEKADTLCTAVLRLLDATASKECRNRS